MLHASASATGPRPTIDTSAEAILHMGDDPAQIGTAGSPPVATSLARPPWPADASAPKVEIGAGWGLRVPGAVAAMAAMAAVTW